MTDRATCHDHDQFYWVDEGCPVCNLVAELAQARADTKAAVAVLVAANEREAGLREAIGYYEIGCTAVGVPHEGERKVLHDCVAKAREIRAALAQPSTEGGG